MFPNAISEDVPAIFHPQDKAGFRHLFSNYPVEAFSSFLQNGQVLVQKLEWNKKLEFHFLTMGQESSHCSISQTIPWTMVEKRLLNDAYIRKRNTDVRTYFVIADHTFLTKPMFTFGMLTVAPFTFHIYQTTSVPIALYILTIPRPLSQDGTFTSKDQYLYKLYVLQPFTCYYIPQKVKYIIVTQHKTYFSIHVTQRIPSGSILYSVNPELPEAVNPLMPNLLNPVSNLLNPVAKLVNQVYGDPREGWVKQDYEQDSQPLDLTTAKKDWLNDLITNLQNEM